MFSIHLLLFLSSVLTRENKTKRKKKEDVIERIRGRLEVTAMLLLNRDFFLLAYMYLMSLFEERDVPSSVHVRQFGAVSSCRFDGLYCSLDADQLMCFFQT